MPYIKLRPALPGGDGDGLTYHAQSFIADPTADHLVLALIDTAQVVDDMTTHDRTAVVRLRRIERVDDPEDRRELQRIMLRAAMRRKGGTVLPLETEDEIEAVFAQFAHPDDPEPTMEFGEDQQEPPQDGGDGAE